MANTRTGMPVTYFRGLPDIASVPFYMIQTDMAPNNVLINIEMATISLFLLTSFLYLRKLL